MVKKLFFVLVFCLVGAVVLAQPPNILNRTFVINVIKDFMLEGGVPNAAIMTDAADEAVVVLIYTAQQRGIIQIQSSDGIAFENSQTPFMELIHLFDELNVVPTDVIVRQTTQGIWRYFIKGLPRPDAANKERHIYAAERNAAGDLVLLNDGSPVYSGRADGGRQTEVIDIITAPNGDWRMFYAALNEQPGNTQTALSSDEGLTWEFESSNPFGDFHNVPSARTINVDPAPLRLADGSYMAVTMREGSLYFWNSINGLEFYPVVDVMLTPEDVRGIVPGEVQGLFDPTLIQLADDTIYMYFTAGVDTHGYILLAKIVPVEAE